MNVVIIRLISIIDQYTTKLEILLDGDITRDVMEEIEHILYKRLYGDWSQLIQYIRENPDVVGELSGTILDLHARYRSIRVKWTQKRLLATVETNTRDLVIEAFKELAKLVYAIVKLDLVELDDRMSSLRKIVERYRTQRALTASEVKYLPRID